MTWRKHFKPVNSVLPVSNKGTGGYTASIDKFNSWLPEIYMGPPDRLQRYAQYEQMDMDHDVAAALDTLAEFSTQRDTNLKVPFQFDFNTPPSPVEAQILERSLKQWAEINEFNKRMFRIFRSVLMYGDQFFIRDPETFKLFWVDPHKVEKVIVNESDGKRVETYFIKDMDLNLQSLVASTNTGKTKGGFANTAFGMPQASLGQQAGASGVSSANYTAGAGTAGTEQAFPIAAEHVIHLSMSEGLDGAWPFGLSVLEPIFKIYKQKSMLEDAMLIYRIHRAPERRVFFIDVGNMPPAKAQQYLERVRYEVQQKRIPNRTGGGSNVTDAAYNPLSTLEDYFFAQTADGRGSKVETLPGGDNLGDINDMLYFNNHMFRALGIPSSYLPTGPEDGSAAVNDGKVGTAFIQEFRFNEKCKRHQRQIVEMFDLEFKLFLKNKGITIDNASFNLEFTPPQNFSDYRQIEIDAARVAVLASYLDIPTVSRRFAFKKWGGFSEEELLENEKMWREEQGFDAAGNDMDEQPGLGQVGVSGADFAADEVDLGDEEFDDEDLGDDVDVSDDDVDTFGEE